MSSNGKWESEWDEIKTKAKLNAKFSLDEVRKEIHKAKSRKVPGADGLMSDTYINDAPI